MAGFYQVYIKPKNILQRSAIEKKLNLAYDWYRINENLYIIYTSKDAKIWQSRLLPYVKKMGNVFVCQLNMRDRHGWMPKAFWEWLKKNQTRQIGGSGGTSSGS